MSVQMPFLNFKGVNSLDLGLYIKSKSSYNSAERDLEFESVPGRNGDLVRDNGRYKNINIPYTLTLVEKDFRTFPELVKSIKEWLLSEQGYFQLWDSYDPEYFRYAAFTGGLDIKNDLYCIGEFTATFNCKPFRYSFEGQKVIIVTENNSTVNNPEIFPSSPYMKVYGTGDITLMINNSEFNFNGIEEYIELDSEIMSAYKENELQNNKMTSIDFPKLQAGDNNISWVGNVSKIEIIPRWCTL